MRLARALLSAHLVAASAHAQSATATAPERPAVVSSTLVITVITSASGVPTLQERVSSWFNDGTQVTVAVAPELVPDRLFSSSQHEVKVWVAVLSPERALVVLVSEDGQVENRILNVPAGLPTSALTEATNFLNARIRGKTLSEAKGELERALEASRAELDQLTQKIVEAGLASWSGGGNEERKLIVRGQAHLLEDLKALEDLERVRLLFDDLETRREVIDLLGRAELAEGVRIFIGSENKLFSLSGSSTIMAPYSDSTGRVVGVLGVIGPTRLNYARVIPMVDYTARMVSKLLSG